MSKNNSNQQNTHNQIGQLMTNLILPERVTVVGVVSKDWSDKLDITRETKMEEIIKYLLKNNVEIDKLILACDCVKALRPTEQPPMQVIKPVVGTENVTVQETGKLIQALEQSLDNPTTNTPANEPGTVCLRARCEVGVEPVNPYEGMSQDEVKRRIDEEFYKGKQKPSDDSTGSNTPYWLAAGAAAIGAIAYSGYRVLTRTPSH